MSVTQLTGWRMGAAWPVRCAVARADL